MGVKLFNKIINLYFLDADGNQTKDKVICPTTGRKPEIEISGKFLPAEKGGSIPAFTISVTNLYLNLLNFQYPKIMVEAGYEGNLTKFKGTILSMFQENPGPDGKTVINCFLGSVENWLDSYLDVSVTSGSTLKDVITKASDALGFTASPQIPAEFQTLTLPADFAENGKAADIINKLFALFPTQQLAITEISGKLYVYSQIGTRAVKTIKIDYLSAPPQKNPGDENGAFYTVFSAPWDPAVQPGVNVVYPAWQYIKYTNLVNAATVTNTARVISVQVHFSTTGSINQMQVQGVGVS